MIKLEVLVEGASDAPVVCEVLSRKFGLAEGRDFRVHKHRGKGKLPTDIMSQPAVHRRGLLDQLPAKLRGFSYLTEDTCVVVILDVDNESCVGLLARLHELVERLTKKPGRILFRIAIEETESWFIADSQAVKTAYPKAKLTKLMRITPDSIVGAWEILAQALGMDANDVSGASKVEWAERIAPHLDLDEPRSPSFRKLIDGFTRELRS